VALTRPALARVLESKLRAEITVSWGRMRQAAACFPPSPWGEDLRLFGEGSGPGLDCDSLERLWLAGAVNEMFHVYDLGTEGDLLKSGRFGHWLDVVQQALSTNRLVTFVTSGSTGEPKRCVHQLAHLKSETAALADLFSDRARIISTVPAHHIYGFLLTAMLPERLGARVLDAAATSLSELASSLRSSDLIVSFPDHWRYLERSLARVPEDVMGTTSTAPCPRWLIEALITKGFSNMVEIYGSSETAGIGTRAWPSAAYSLLPHWRREQGEAGETILVHAAGHRVVPMDNLVFEDQCRFSIEGRVDHAVQVGGINVHPAAVARRLAEHPLVAEAAVRPMRPDEGNRLKAFIVLVDRAPDEEDAHRSVSDWIESNLTTAERPKMLTFGPALPRSPLGKLADW
jgi:4-coumarate--CoA ligase (photoactive yellow protein activation family)